jgi:hypothetical protein
MVRTFQRAITPCYLPESAVFPHRPKSRRFGAFRNRAALVLGCSSLLLAAVPGAALAGPGTVKLTHAYAGPISATDPRCTAEPNGSAAYGTVAPYDSSTPISSPQAINGNDTNGTGTPPANVPSVASMHPSLQAGAHSDMCVAFTLTPNMESTFIRTSSNTNGVRLADPNYPDVDATHVVPADGVTAADAMDNIGLDLPAGYLANPDAQATCTDAQFGVGNYFDPDRAGGCPADANGYTDAQVGTAYVRLSSFLLGALAQQLAFGGAPSNVTDPNNPWANYGGKVINLTHGPNELARLGVSVKIQGFNIAPAKFIVRLVVAPGGKVRSIVSGAPNNLYLGSDIDATTGQPVAGAQLNPLYVESVGIRIWGQNGTDPGRHMLAPFSQNGTDCSTPATGSVAVTTYKGVSSTINTPAYSLTGCGSLAFNPTVAVTTDQHSPGVPTGVQVAVNIPQSTSGNETALLKNAVVTLPTGLEIGAQVGSGDGGLKLCSADAFGADTIDAATCPAGSQVGTVTIHSPLQTLPFTGQVFLGPQPAAGALPSIYIQAVPQGATAADAPRIKLVGATSIDASGNLTTTFNDEPQLRFSQLLLNFTGGSHALFSTPRACGSPSGTSQLTSYSSSTPVTSTSTLTIDQNCTTPAFVPTLSMVPANPAAGASSPTTITIARPDGSPWMTSLSMSLPSGFLANLNAATECASADAATGACPDSSRIASITAQSGVGDSPLALGGEMYLSQHTGADVADGVIVVPAKIGDLDLGNVVVPVSIGLRPTDAGLTLNAVEPTRFNGVALNLRSIAVTLDRVGFPLNPTACGPLGASAQVADDAGETVGASTTVSYTGCAGLPFAPSISASIAGPYTANSHPQIKVSMRTRPGDSNLKSTDVSLPVGVSSDLKNLQHPCDQALFNAGTCPASTRVGSASATVSIAPDTITGDVYLVHIPGQSLPGIGMNFTGRFAQRVLSTVSIASNGRLITKFDAIPDLPLTTLNLTIDGGAADPLVLSSAICDAPSSFDTTFGGQGGQSTSVKVPFSCATALPKPTVKWSKKSGITITVKGPTGKKLKSAKLTLPAHYKLKTTKAGKKAVKLTSKGGKSKLKSTKTTVTATATAKTGATSFKLKLGTKAYSAPKTFKKGKKLKLKISATVVGGKAVSQTITVKVAR